MPLPAASALEPSPPAWDHLPMALAPILVTGSHRCGSTWVGKTLCRAPGMAYLDEPFHMKHRPGPCRAKWESWYAYLTAENAAPYEEALADTLGHRYSYGAELLSLRSPRDVGRMLRDAGRCAGRRRRGDRALMKDPIAFFSAPWLAERFAMQVVVLVRHPAAFASSLKRLDWRFDFHNWLDQPLLMRDWLGPWEQQLRAAAETPLDVIEEAALCWNVIYEVAARMRAQHSDWIFLTHEELSIDPVGKFRTLFEQLAVPFDDELRDWLQATTGANNPAEAPTGTAHALARDSRANVRNWTSRLEPSEIDRLRAATEAVTEQWYGSDAWTP